MDKIERFHLSRRGKVLVPTTFGRGRGQRGTTKQGKGAGGVSGARANTARAQVAAGGSATAEHLGGDDQVLP